MNAEIWVPGRARTKGSLKPVVSGRGSGRIKVGLVESGEYSKPWKNTMIREIRAQVGPENCVHYDGPVRVICAFLFAPEGFELDACGWPVAIEYGDVDKLERNVLDALTQSGLIKDDKLVVILESVKRFALRGEVAGVRIGVRGLV